MISAKEVRERAIEAMEKIREETVKKDKLFKEYCLPLCLKDIEKEILNNITKSSLIIEHAAQKLMCSTDQLKLIVVPELEKLGYKITVETYFNHDTTLEINW